MKSWEQRERAQLTLAKEIGYVKKPHGDRLRVALAFPNTYWVGMSNLGFQTVYRLFNAEDDIVCERFFLPPKQELAELSASKTPLLTLESQTPVGDFDVVAFSVSFEWDYVNVLTLLRLAGIPRYAAERSTAASAGRHRRRGDVRQPRTARAVRRRDRRRRRRSAGARPAPRALPRPPIAPTCCGCSPPSAASTSRRSTSRTTRPTARWPGTRVRAGVDAPLPVRKAALKTTDAVDPPATSIFTPDTEFGSRFLVEVVRGCANLCRFCWAGYNYLPVRAFPADRILQLAREARVAFEPRRPGVDRALRSSGHRADSRAPARDGLRDQPGVAAARRSDRVDRPDAAARAASARITIAPETGSDRLRRVINKTVTNDEILDRADLIFANGIENLKLYYMIGLPTETDDDLVAIRDLTLQMRERMLKYARRKGQIGRIIGSVNPLIPKPGTAYQWLPMEDPAVIDRKIKRLRALTADIDNVYFNIKSERHSYYQALLSLGDRRVAPAIEAAERNGQNWRAAVAEAGIDGDFYIFRDRSQRRGAALGHHRRRHEAAVLPGRVRRRASARNGRCRRSARRKTRSCCRLSSSRIGIDRRLIELDDCRYPIPITTGDRRPLLVFLKRLENQLAQLVLRRACRRSAAAARSCAARR